MARRVALTFVALVAVALVVQPALGQQPRRGGVVRIADREAPNLDPHLSISFLTHSWANMVYSQLGGIRTAPSRSTRLISPSSRTSRRSGSTRVPPSSSSR